MTQRMSFYFLQPCTLSALIVVLGSLTVADQSYFRQEEEVSWCSVSIISVYVVGMEANL